jgi:hypothetical protein
MRTKGGASASTSKPQPSNTDRWLMIDELSAAGNGRYHSGAKGSSYRNRVTSHIKA